MGAKDAVFLTEELAIDLASLAKSDRRGTIRAGRAAIPTRGAGGMPPIRGILLADLQSGGTADCAATTLIEDLTLQKITLLGGPITGGTFTITFKGRTSAAIAYNAAPEKVQAALEKLETIGPNNVAVSLGEQIYSNSDTGVDTQETPGIWLVNFIGVFAGRTDTPLMTVDGSNLIGDVFAIVDAAETWQDTGKVFTARAIIPVGSPTPMRAGAVVVCLHFPGLCYGVIACEPRQFGGAY